MSVGVCVWFWGVVIVFSLFFPPARTRLHARPGSTLSDNTVSQFGIGVFAFGIKQSRTRAFKPAAIARV